MTYRLHHVTLQMLGYDGEDGAITVDEDEDGIWLALEADDGKTKATAHLSAAQADALREELNVRLREVAKA